MHSLGQLTHTRRSDGVPELSWITVTSIKYLSKYDSRIEDSGNQSVGIRIDERHDTRDETVTPLLLKNIRLFSIDILLAQQLHRLVATALALRYPLPLHCFLEASSFGVLLFSSL